MKPFHSELNNMITKITYGVYLPLYLQENVYFYLLYDEGDCFLRPQLIMVSSNSSRVYAHSILWSVSRKKTLYPLLSKLTTRNCLRK